MDEEFKEMFKDEIRKSLTNILTKFLIDFINFMSTEVDYYNPKKLINFIEKWIETHISEMELNENTIEKVQTYLDEYKED